MENYTQSANSLFKFMPKLSYLKEILKNKAIIPRYCDEDISYLNWEYNFLSFPMVCFCDIRFSKVKEHISFYGGYGIGLNKKWGIKQGVQALQYINSNSVLNNELIDVFKYALNDNENVSNIYKSFLIYTLLYQKPLKGIMSVYDTRNKVWKEKEKIFQDEQEWRYINPLIKNITTDSGFIIRSNNIEDNRHKKLKEIYNNEIKKHKECWLNFNYDDIKYLIVKTEKQRENLLKFILNKLQLDVVDAMKLSSKILTTKEIEEDI